MDCVRNTLVRRQKISAASGEVWQRIIREPHHDDRERWCVYLYKNIINNYGNNLLYNNFACLDKSTIHGVRSSDN